MDMELTFSLDQLLPQTASDVWTDLRIVIHAYYARVQCAVGYLRRWLRIRALQTRSNGKEVLEAPNSLGPICPLLFLSCRENIFCPCTRVVGRVLVAAVGPFSGTRSGHHGKQRV